MDILRGLFPQRLADGTGTSPKGARLALGGLIGRRTGGVVRPGVLVDDMSAVVSSTGSLAYSVRPFVAVSKYTDANGPTLFANDQTFTIATTDAPDTNSRIDLVYAIQHLRADVDGGVGTTNKAEVLVAQGSVSATPSPPALPAGAVGLATIRVTALATSTAGLVFTRVHDWVSANGGLVPTAKGARTYTAWNGTEEQIVRVGINIAGWTEAQCAAAYEMEGHYVSGGGIPNTNENGDITITFPTAFPVALGTVHFTSTTGAGAVSFTCTYGSSDRTKITARAFNGVGVPYANQPVSVMWRATGR